MFLGVSSLLIFRRKRTTQKLFLFLWLSLSLFVFDHSGIIKGAFCGMQPRAFFFFVVRARMISELSTAASEIQMHPSPGSGPHRSGTGINAPGRRVDCSQPHEKVFFLDWAQHPCSCGYTQQVPPCGKCFGDFLDGKRLFHTSILSKALAEDAS